MTLSLALARAPSWLSDWCLLAPLAISTAGPAQSGAGASGRAAPPCTGSLAQAIGLLAQPRGRGVCGAGSYITMNKAFGRGRVIGGVPGSKIPGCTEDLGGPSLLLQADASARKTPEPEGSRLIAWRDSDSPDRKSVHFPPTRRSIPLSSPTAESTCPRDERVEILMGKPLAFTAHCAKLTWVPSQVK